MLTRAISSFLPTALIASATASALGDPSTQWLMYPITELGTTGGWNISVPPSNDGSSDRIPLPFSFCFYEVSYTGVYVNNNGVVSFTEPLGGLPGDGMASASMGLIAPFWSDVDTRNRDGVDSGGNLVLHRTFDTDAVPGDDIFVVTWDSVGYFDQHNDRRNTFQLVLAADPNRWGLGLNAAISYGNMDWTTGDASGGVDGFGGIAATIGIARGDGLSMDQLGRFDRPGMEYSGNGLGGQTSGVDWLDYRTVFFNACEGVIPEPSAIWLLAAAGLLGVRRR